MFTANENFFFLEIFDYWSFLRIPNYNAFLWIYQSEVDSLPFMECVWVPQIGSHEEKLV